MTYEELKAQRDELLTALKYIHQCGSRPIRDGENLTGRLSQINMWARQSIAKIEATQENQA